ncbi:MAG: hypothetical protein WBN99_05675 [Mycobacterium sp.]
MPGGGPDPRRATLNHKQPTTSSSRRRVIGKREVNGTALIVRAEDAHRCTYRPS